MVELMVKGAGPHGATPIGFGSLADDRRRGRGVAGRGIAGAARLHPSRNELGRVRRQYGRFPAEQSFALRHGPASVNEVEKWINYRESRFNAQRSIEFGRS